MILEMSWIFRVHRISMFYVCGSMYKKIILEICPCPYFLLLFVGSICDYEMKYNEIIANWAEKYNNISKAQSNKKLILQPNNPNHN